MPTPTTQISFGESTTDSDVYALVDLDDDSNVDDDGNVLSTFLDSERVYILVHVEPGAVIESIDCSQGSIVNENTAQTVIREKIIEDVVFKSAEDGYQLQHYPSGGVTAEWEGRSGTLQVTDRDVTCPEGPRIATLTYSYSAWLYILEVNSLDIEVGDDFDVDVSFKVVRS